MFDDTGLPNSARDATAGGSATDGVAPAAGPPPRFGRLALCVAAMSALAIGVMGTVAYGVWFNHDQQAYAAAIVGARQALGTSASATAGKVAVAYSASTAVAPATATTALAKPQPPAAHDTTTGTTSDITPGTTPSLAQVPVMDPEPGGPLASYSGQVVGRSAQPAQVVVAANAAAAAPASSSVSARPAASSGNPPAQQVASVRPGKEGRATPPEHRASSANARHKDTSLFARVGQFLRRVSYRQHGNPNPSRQDNYSHP